MSLSIADSAVSAMPRRTEGEADLLRHAWPAARLAEGIAMLCRRIGLAPRRAAVPFPADAIGGGATVAERIEAAAARAGASAESVELRADDIAALLHGDTAATIRIEVGGEVCHLLFAGARFGTPRMLGPDGRLHRVDAGDVETALLATPARRSRREVDGLLDVAGVSGARRTAVRAALVRGQLAETAIRGVTLLRLPATAPLMRQLRQAGGLRTASSVAAAYVALSAIEVGAWGLIGTALLAGQLDFGILAAWFLLLVTAGPIQLASGWMSGRLSLDFARVVKKRLLEGAFRADPDATRRAGFGHIHARVLESQAFETAAVGAVLIAATAAVELAIAVWLLVAGAGGTLLAFLLAFWLVATTLVFRRYARASAAWTRTRLDVTQHLVERMVGHRTILAQDEPERRDGEDDAETDAYLGQSRRLDRLAQALLVAMPGAWTVVGLLGLLPALAGGSASAGSIAVALGGVVLAGRALGGVVAAQATASRALVAWREIAPLFRTGGGPDTAAPTAVPSAGSGPVLSAEGLTFGYGGRGTPVVRELTLSLAKGDRVLLEGGSGSGKSTVASLLSGLRLPDRGRLAAGGMERIAVGAAWHARVSQAPQFHENHILGGSLAFNLLMGRAWPPAPEDLAEAEDLCRELGLGDLVDRMPGGLMQTVGETGWQLSHGERSRVFLARALLQNADVAILDESFAALDPETARLCLETAARRARTLLVVAHP